MAHHSSQWGGLPMLICVLCPLFLPCLTHLFPVHHGQHHQQLFISAATAECVCHTLCLFDVSWHDSLPSFPQGKLSCSSCPQRILQLEIWCSVIPKSTFPTQHGDWLMLLVPPQDKPTAFFPDTNELAFPELHKERRQKRLSKTLDNVPKCPKWELPKSNTEEYPKRNPRKREF